MHTIKLIEFKFKINNIVRISLRRRQLSNGNNQMEISNGQKNYSKFIL